MKQYTDLKQSRRLAEILSLESADMCYIEGKAHLGFLYEEYKEFGDNVLQKYEPCWSIAALLSVLPKPHLSQTFDGDWICIADGVKSKRRIYHSEPCDNPVDTLVDMIIKLHKLNKLVL